VVKWVMHAVCTFCGSRVRAKQRERERENTNEKDIRQTKKERRKARKAIDGCFPLSKGKRNY
jgi:hypothetical protein